MCEDDGPEGVAVFLLLVDTVRSRGKILYLFFGRNELRCQGVL